MSVQVAKTAGFCFGVKRAVDMAFQAAHENGPVRTLGELIHNPQIVAELDRCGVKVAGSVAECPDGCSVVIRSHGVAKSVYGEIEERGLRCVDTTCPFVSKLHAIVERCNGEGRDILIAGDASHPEIQGVLGYCADQAETPAEFMIRKSGEPSRVFTFNSLSELENIEKKEPFMGQKPAVMLAQTTFNTNEWIKCVNFARKVYTNIKIFDTICSATEERQQEAAKLAQKADFMIVIGGRHSSNTKKLWEICRNYCPTVLVESAAELDGALLSSYSNIGITAGASTPVRIIKEVQEMSENLTNEANATEEVSFAEMLEQNFKSTYTGEKVTGVITGITPTEIIVEIGAKQTGYIPLHELTDDPAAKAEDLVKIGDELTLKVLRVNDVEGTIMLSKKKVDAEASFDKIMAASENGDVLEGTVIEIVKGGVVALCDSIKVFIPASQATLSRNEPLDGLLKKDVRFKILEVNAGRKRAVGSIRAVLAEERKAQEEIFWQTAEIGKAYTGVVKSLTSYGAFVDLGGVDGMIHVSELSWSRIKNPAEVVSIGDTVEVYIKDLDTEKKKVSLGYKKAEDNPWAVLERDYPVGSVVKVKIVSLTTFGAFAQIIPSIDGLIHISQIAKERINKPADVLSVGQEVDVMITDIDFDKKRVSLSMKALLTDEEEAPAEDIQE